MIKKYMQDPRGFKIDTKEMHYLAKIIEEDEDEEEAVFTSKRFYLSGNNDYQQLVHWFKKRTRLT